MSQSLTLSLIEEKVRAQLDRISEDAGYYFKPKVFGIGFDEGSEEDYIPDEVFSRFIHIHESVRLNNPEPGSGFDEIVNRFLDSIAKPDLSESSEDPIDTEASKRALESGDVFGAMFAANANRDFNPSAPLHVEGCAAQVNSEFSGTLEAQTWRDLIIALNKGLDEDLQIDVNLAATLDNPVGEDRSRA